MGTRYSQAHVLASAHPKLQEIDLHSYGAVLSSLCLAVFKDFYFLLNNNLLMKLGQEKEKDTVGFVLIYMM